MANLNWKLLFYRAVMPTLRRMRPEQADLALTGLGRMVATMQPQWASSLDEAARRAGEVLGDAIHPRTFRRELAGATARSLARDTPLEGLDDRAFDERFDVEGFEHVVAALAAGRGLVLVHAHFGAFLSALHWIYRQDLPVRSLIQRPHHISAELQAFLDRDSGPHPQHTLFLRRDLEGTRAAGVLLGARALLRDGMALCVCGDVPWAGGTEADWLGRRWRILDHWAHLAASTGAAVIPTFALHIPGGRTSIRFDAPRRVTSSGTRTALDWYLNCLDRQVRRHPEQAVPYWTWRSYRLPVEPALGLSDSPIAQEARPIGRSQPLATRQVGP